MEVGNHFCLFPFYLSCPMPKKTIKELGEKALVARFGALVGASLTGEVIVGPGDDCAVLATGGDRLLLLACDMMAEGVHFRRDWATPWQLGWKAVAQNISDIAAMGGIPFAVVASISAPGDLPEAFAVEIAEGMVACTTQFGASLVGGDLVGSTGPVTIDVAITGWVTRDHLLLRRGAQPGELLLVTNTLGRSAAGLAALQQGRRDATDPAVVEAIRAHHEPVPRVKEAEAISATGLATAMMDLSDGLAEDLPRLCAQSGVGARIREECLPIAASCWQVADLLGANARALAVTGGEDYELMLTCPREAAPTLQAAVQEATGVSLTVIGECTRARDMVLVTAEGTVRPLGRGFNHFGVTPEAA